MGNRVAHGYDLWVDPISPIKGEAAASFSNVSIFRQNKHDIGKLTLY